MDSLSENDDSDCKISSLQQKRSRRRPNHHRPRSRYKSVSKKKESRHNDNKKDKREESESAIERENLQTNAKRHKSPSVCVVPQCKSSKNAHCPTADEECSLRADGTAGGSMTQRPHLDHIVSDESVTKARHGRCCTCFFCAFLCCSTVCYIFCPPLPSQITRKLAFHPPRRGAFYQLKYVNAFGVEVVAMSAAQVYNKPNVRFVPLVDNSDLAEFVEMAMVDSELFFVKTRKKNYLVCLRFWTNPKSDLANATDLGMFAQMDINFHDLACLFKADVYAYDYSGYGFSSGTPLEKNIYDDVAAVYAHIRNKCPNARIVLMGFSMGTAVSVDMASKRPNRLVGVILVAPFASGLRLLRANPEKSSTNCCDPFQSIDKAAMINVPTLLIHGAMDDVVPIEHSVALHKRLRKPVEPLYIDKANHSNVLCRRFPQCIDRIQRFLRTELDNI